MMRIFIIQVHDPVFHLEVDEAPRLYSELSCHIYHQVHCSIASRIFMQNGTVALYFGFSKNDLVS